MVQSQFTDLSVATIKLLVPEETELNFFCFLFTPDKWSPALQIRTVLLSIQALLSAPNPDDPLANDVAELWKVNEVRSLSQSLKIRADPINNVST